METQNTVRRWSLLIFYDSLCFENIHLIFKTNLNDNTVLFLTTPIPHNNSSSQQSSLFPRAFSQNDTTLPLFAGSIDPNSLLRSFFPASSGRSKIPNCFFLDGCNCGLNCVWVIPNCNDGSFTRGAWFVAQERYTEREMCLYRSMIIWYFARYLIYCEMTCLVNNEFWELSNPSRGLLRSHENLITCTILILNSGISLFFHSALEILPTTQRSWLTSQKNYRSITRVV